MKKLIFCFVLAALLLAVPVMADEGGVVDWMELASEVITYILGLVGVWVLGWLGAWLRKKRDAVADEDDRTWRKNILEMVAEACESARDYVQQTYVEPIKGTADWTDKAKSAAKYYAVERAEDILGEGWMDKLAEIVEEPEKYIEAKIEQLCLAAKK